MFQTSLMPMPQSLGWTHPGIDQARAERAGELAKRYPRPRQGEFALAMCSRHPYAVDYLEQAPVLLLAVASAGSRRPVQTPFTPPLNGRTYGAVLEEWGKLVAIGWKLPKVLAHYKIAPAFKAVLPGACQAVYLWPIQVMTRQMTNAEIGGIIPSNKTRQGSWFRALVNWYGQHNRRNDAIASQGIDHPLAYARWAAGAFADRRWCTNHFERVAADLADFAIARGPAFDVNWSLLRAVDNCGLWHQELAKRQEAAAFADDPPADYGDMPDVFVASTGHRVVALRTRRALYDEGRAMTHCVADYADDVALGYSRIFSVRRPDGRPICTLELSCKQDALERRIDEEMARVIAGPNGPVMMVTPSRRPWRPVQAQGWRGHWSDPRPPQPEEAATPVQEFLQAHCPAWPR